MGILRAPSAANRPAPLPFGSPQQRASFWFPGTRPMVQILMHLSIESKNLMPRLFFHVSRSQGNRIYRRLSFITKHGTLCYLNWCGGCERVSEPNGAGYRTKDHTFSQLELLSIFPFSTKKLTVSINLVIVMQNFACTSVGEPLM